MFGANNNSGKLRKPFIFVDGIDFGISAPANVPGNEFSDYGLRYGDRGWRQYLLGLGWKKDKKTEKDDLNIKKVSILMKKLCAEEYDMVMLDLVEGAGDIPTNAMALARLIQMVNDDLISNNSKNQIVVLGASMGGQVSRYALRYMELNPLVYGPHNTRLFISLDSPNRGANIPLGTQYAINHASFQMAATGLPFLGVDALVSPASKQLLLYHYIASDIGDRIAKPFQEHIDLYDNNPNMTTFPEVPKLVAITNGSGFGLGQGYGPGALTINLVTPRRFLVRAVGSNSENTIYSEQYLSEIEFIETTKVWLEGWLGNWFSELISWVVKKTVIVNANVVEMENTLPFDNTSGGLRGTNEDFAQQLPASAWTGNLFNLHAEHCCHSFIPTYSAMGIHLSQINNNITQSMNNVLGVSSYPAYPNNKTLTPFDVIYSPMSPDANYEHITVNDENVEWIMNEISPPDLYLQNRPLSNPIVNNIPPLNGYSYEARNTITIGKNVTTSQMINDFIVDGNGTTVDFRAGKSISIKDGTLFKEGCNVHLFIDEFDCAAVHRLAYFGSNDGTVKGDNYDAALSGIEIPVQEIKKTFPIISTNIFPNPITDHLHIDYSVQQEGKVNIFVYNFLGQKMAELVSTNQHQAGRHSATLDARKFSSGIYYIRIFSNGESETIKVVKMK